MDQSKKSLINVSCAEPTRINKYLSSIGVRSRREVDALIEAGQILLNGEILESQGVKVKTDDQIEILDNAKNVTVILNKPVGYISDSFSSPTHPPAISLVTSKDFEVKELHVLGRLDADSRGLLVLSSSGVIAKTLIGPMSEVEKEYEVYVRGPINETKISKLRSGMSLDGEKLKDAKVTQLSENALQIILREGKNRQIRRMCEKVDLIVTDLRRVRIGKVKLENLSEGHWRKLEDSESFT